MTAVSPVNPQGNAQQPLPNAPRVNNLARVVEHAVDGVNLPPMENLNIQGVQNQKIIIHVKENPSLFKSFLNGAASAAGGGVGAYAVYKTAEIIVGLWRGATAGAAAGGPAGALAGGAIGGIVALLV